MENIPNAYDTRVVNCVAETARRRSTQNSTLPCPALVHSNILQILC
jgi:hypothetical protein